MVTACFATLNTYGKREAELETIIGVFEMVLNGYEFDRVREAFKEHLRTSKDFPTPSDIVNIINPRKVWCVEKYKAIKKDIENDKFVTKEEIKYVNDYLNR